eukprot:TRINITY_DN3450_c0_g1_i1.p1 TRINITY_DN3450_c0_g1~~TRINITY_DN3450_c0_g1_i1.p1  ORF type:complete len:802 (+),score=223.99 TRINITY_DN3450_c0_g1_i1:279-2684(+)
MSHLRERSSSSGPATIARPMFYSTPTSPAHPHANNMHSLHAAPVTNGSHIVAPKQEQIHQLILEEQHRLNTGPHIPQSPQKTQPADGQDDASSVTGDLPPPDRSSSASAPPLLEPSNVFASNNRFANIFSGQFDIRATEDYYQFYHEFGLKFGKLPPPLEPAPFVFDGMEDDQSQDGVPNGVGRFWKYDYAGTMRNADQEPPQPAQQVQPPPLDSLTLDAQNHMQELNLGRSSNMSIPTSNIWNPLPRKIARIPSEFSGPDTRAHLDVGHKEMMHLIHSDSYSSSPSAQTAIKAAQFIFGGEDERDHSGYGRDDVRIKQIDPYPYFENGHNRNDSHQQGINHQQNMEQSGQNNGARSNVVCRYYTAGYCSRGEKCYYSHDAAQAPTEQQTKQKEGKSRGKASKSPRVSVNNITPVNPAGNSSSPSAAISSPPPQNNNNVSPSPNGRASAGITSPSKSPELDASGEQFYTNFDQLIGKIYTVSKDQQGCRFLQKKLEEQDPKVIEVIFNEVYDHITELMTDPFGNYLCQKLLEHCNDTQRYKIVERVAPELVTISKNMHGTRAVQKMIECLSSSPQVIELIKRSLSAHVVELIQDLNGNHVIQRCLHRLSAEDNNQFIYNAVTSGNNCVQVATHRHGCCVLQRCIDNASEKQKVQLIQEIIKNALTLVQDPYGNYVVQYVLDLPFPNLVEALIQSFLGHLRQLATQKFSSNVIEKTLGVATPYTRSLMIKEILQENTLSAMLQDPFANYVIQTALNISEPHQHNELVENIRPHLNQLRNTPYGKRIQNKITKETNDRHPKHK